MCRLCNSTTPAALTASLPRAPAGEAGAAVMERNLPEAAGQPGRRVLIKGGSVLSMDDAVGNFATGDVLIDGAKIVEVAAKIDAPDAAVIDAAGKIVMPGFIDTHHHQFETALRSSLSDAILRPDIQQQGPNEYSTRADHAPGNKTFHVLALKRQQITHLGIFYF